MKVTCVTCAQPTTDQHSFGPYQHRECRKCFNKRAEKHKGSFYDAYMALLHEAKGKG